MNTISVLWRWTLLVGFGALGCFPEQDPNADNGSAGKSSASQRGKSSTHTGGAGRASNAGASPSTGGAPSSEGGSDSPGPAGGAPAGGAPDYIETRVLSDKCNPVNSSLLLPQRDAVATDAQQTPTLPVRVNDLWTSFNLHCGHCHVDAGLGGYQVNRHSFGALVTQPIVDTYIKATNPQLAMPRGKEGAGDDLGIDFTTRPEGDPIVALASALTQWIASAPPNQAPSDDLFYIPNPDYGKQSLYLMTPNVAAQQTNLGNCVPAWNFTVGWGADRHQKMRELDDRFAKAARVPPAPPGEEATPVEQQLGLPLHLSETDLFTFDTQELARSGVFAFAPAYPLWSDNSGKLRYVRVPLGQSIHFNKLTQEFKIPPNTRFYKTFMKEVVDRVSKRKRYRKIETRLIVSRPDVGWGDPGALFGTYVWNEDETEATLLGHNAATGADELLRDLTPFPDKIISYYTDEPAADAIRFTDPKPSNETYQLEQAGLLRHYVLPGKERCRECHMGSVRKDFVLGFTPIQISRRPTNEGGIYEETSHDELTQLDRLSALGVITGVDSVADIPLLEKSQGDRKPRNDQELLAQGYMFGNCAHCHHPGGYATNSVPELGDKLNFWPSIEGGIFQFPLDRISPRTSRGAEGRAVPYITPSLYDLLPYGYPLNGNVGGYVHKFFTDISDEPVFDLAPWRSLIYRNTQTPFTYGEDFTIFPHMPLATSGYDCRVSQILGSWMVSIPAVRKNPSLAETYWGDPTQPGPFNEFPGDPLIDNAPQPYVEVLPGDSSYSAASIAASQRLEAFQHGMRYNACPSNADVIDLELAPEGPTIGIPADNVAPKDGIPDHTHFVATDLTESPGAWSPRGTTWNQVLVKHDFTDLAASVKQVVSLLTDNGGVVFDQKLKDFVSKPFPFAPWKNDPKCDFDKPAFSNNLAKSYDGTNRPRPRWLDIAKLAPTTPVMEKLPGGNIYDMICINCHGPNMDSKGRQADTVQQLTGGGSRVANFMTGLFGPLASPGDARAGESGFKSVITPSITANDWGARYMTWMALGGTTTPIPQLVLNLVGRTPVAGITRPGALSDTVSANMLQAAQGACRALNFLDFTTLDLAAPNKFGFRGSTKLIDTNGDEELWERLCAINNPPMVRGILIKGGGTSPRFSQSTLYESSAYPANTPVGAQGGRIVLSSPSGGVTADNYAPWCVAQTTIDNSPGSQAAQKAIAKFLADNTVDGHPPPMCPTELQGTQPSTERLDAFALRGAINAGFAVFWYLDQVSKKTTGLNTARFDECTLAPSSQ